jgi:hypothetical protein
VSELFYFLFFYFLNTDFESLHNEVNDESPIEITSGIRVRRCNHRQLNFNPAREFLAKARSNTSLDPLGDK